MTRLLIALLVLLSSASGFAQPQGSGDDIERDTRRSERWRGGWRHRDGAHLRFFRDYHLPAGSSVSEPIVVIGASATIDGHADDDVVVIGGKLKVGPTATVRGDVVAVGGQAEIDPAATIEGRVRRRPGRGPSVDIDWGWGPWSGRDRFWRAAAFGATLTRLTVTLLVVLLAAVFAPAWVKGLAARIADAPGAAAGVGLAGEIAITPLVVALVVSLVISLVGIPLLLALPFALLGFALVWASGLAAVAALVGATLRRGQPENSEHLLANVALGFGTIAAITLVGHVVALGAGWFMPLAGALRSVGFLIEFVAWTVGLGAVLLAAWNGRPASAPPPLPSTAPASA